MSHATSEPTLALFGIGRACNNESLVIIKAMIVCKFSGIMSSGSHSLELALDHILSVLSNTVVDKVIAELESCGFQCLIGGIGGNGVEIQFAASS
uniref:Uncharacterized protein MANES_09G165700 n=1 Tax=Rhizophora mucronata TaxID=61149 RepID=A0A2P2JV04_RHIMU